MLKLEGAQRVHISGNWIF